MKFFSIYRPDPKTAAGPPSKEHMEQMGKLIEESTKAGTLLATGGLLPISQGGARLRRSAGNINVVDGPFAEAKEIIGGFAILQANSREHALQLVRDFLKVAGDGECELHQIMEQLPPER